MVLEELEELDGLGMLLDSEFDIFCEVDELEIFEIFCAIFVFSNIICLESFI